MEKLITRKDEARLLGSSLATLDAARLGGQIAFVQYVENGCVYFTESGLQEYIARSTHRVRVPAVSATSRTQRASCK